MKTSFSRFTTLGPVSRATAFFAFLGFFLTLVSCSAKKDTHESLMKEQAGLYQEMSVVLTDLSKGGDIEAGAKKLTDLVSTLRDNRVRAAALEKPGEEEVLRLAQMPELSDAHKAFFEAQSAFASSKHVSPQIFNILSGLHESMPVPGEGNPS